MTQLPAPNRTPTKVVLTVLVWLLHTGLFIYFSDDLRWIITGSALFFVCYPLIFNYWGYQGRYIEWSPGRALFAVVVGWLISTLLIRTPEHALFWVLLGLWQSSYSSGPVDVRRQQRQKRSAKDLNI